MSQAMKYVNLYFDPELADFFCIASKVRYPLTRKASVKDIIEAHGPPHTEVGEILADGFPVGFDYIPRVGQIIVIKAALAPFDITIPSLLRPRSFNDIRFAVDVNVGKLARFLRMMGYDTLFEQRLKDKEIAFFAHEQKRIVLTRDRGLLKHGLIEFGRLVRSQKPGEQLRETAAFFGLNCRKMFTRCLHCNHLIEDVAKELILHRLEPKTKKFFNKFSICRGCDRIYWPGSHWEKMNKLVKIVGIC